MTQPLDINAVSAHYGTTKVLEDLSLSVQAGELVSLLGASGCGKTTTLRLIAGFLSPTAGSIAPEGERLVAWRTGCGLVDDVELVVDQRRTRDRLGEGVLPAGD